MKLSTNKPNKIFRILCWILLGATAIRALGLILNLIVFATGAAKGAGNVLDVGFLTFRLTADTLPIREAATMQFICGAAQMLVGIVMALMLFKVIWNILRSIINAEPFSEKVSANLKKMGWIELVGGLLVSILQIVSSRAVFDGYDMKSLFLNDSIIGVNCNMFNIDTTFLFIALVMFLLSYIFRYGTKLQQLSDETL